MNEAVIKRIVCEAFEKAKKACPKHSKYALAKHIGDTINLSTKTLERAYDKYVLDKKKGNTIGEASLNLLCEYLGYKNFENYRRERLNEEEKIDFAEVKPFLKNSQEKILIVVGIILVVVLVVTYFVKKDTGVATTSSINESICMTWIETHYEKISCNTKPYSKHGTNVIPYEEMKIKNFKKIEVNMATDFFAPVTNKPLIWYSKNKNGEIEYFTSPGLHPITGKTLNEITPYIIQKYVPLHSNSIDSFVE